MRIESKNAEVEMTKPVRQDKADQVGRIIVQRPYWISRHAQGYYVEEIWTNCDSRKDIRCKKTGNRITQARPQSGTTEPPGKDQRGQSENTGGREHRVRSEKLQNQASREENRET